MAEQVTGRVNYVDTAVAEEVQRGREGGEWFPLVAGLLRESRATAANSGELFRAAARQKVRVEDLLGIMRRCTVLKEVNGSRADDELRRCEVLGCADMVPLFAGSASAT